MPIYKMTGKKDGKQKYRVRINFKDNLGNSKQIDRVAYGLEDAKQLERELNYQIKQETPAANLKLQELYDEYIKNKTHEAKESTVQNNKSNLKRHVLPTYGDFKIDKLTVPVLRQWKKDINEKKLALYTKRNIFAAFNTLLNYAKRVEYIQANPLDKIGNFINPLEVPTEMDFYTAEEFKKFIAMAKKLAEKSESQNDLMEWHYYVFFSLAFYTGARKGEIHALQWTDIDNGYMSITKSLNQKLKGGDRVTSPKNRSSIRTLQLPKPLINILNEHYQRCKKFDNFNDSYKICGGTNALRDATVQKRNKIYSQTAKLKTITIHEFRHSHVSVLANEGINIQEVARRLGHSKVSTTWDTYSHLYPRQEEKAVAILDKIV